MEPQKPFRQVDPVFLKSIAKGDVRTPSLYYHPNPLVRNFFWRRLRMIDAHMNSLGIYSGRCLDFGGGSGVFLPTLSHRFTHVTCIDVEATDAQKVCQQYGLANVTLTEADIRNVDYSAAPFDAIVAADVLEHFYHLEEPVEAIRNWLSPQGYLFTSLPTENWLYLILRKLFGIKKPEDHYHKAVEVESFLQHTGFRALHRTHLPFIIPFASLFIVTTWKYK